MRTADSGGINNDSEDMESDGEHLTRLATKLGRKSKAVKKNTDALEDVGDANNGAAISRGRTNMPESNGISESLHLEDLEAEYDLEEGNNSDGSKETDGHNERHDMKMGPRNGVSIKQVDAVSEAEENVSALHKEDQPEVLLRDAPKLAGLLLEMKEGLDQIKSKVQVLVQKVKEGKYATKDGISYLEVKHLLLLSYCQSIVYYILRKVQGCSVQGHPVANCLVEIRLFLEKIRPIDKKLQYQIEKLSKIANNAPNKGISNTNEESSVADKDAALKYRPNPDMLVSKLDQAAQDREGLYRPPMFAPTAMDEDMNSRNRRLELRKQKEALQKASRSAFVKQLANELEGKPEEIREIVGAESKELFRERSKLEERSRQEEDLFTRVPLSRIEKKRLKHVKKSRNGLLGMMDDFNDDISGLVAMEEDNVSRLDGNHVHPRKEGRRKFKKHKMKH